MSELRQNRNVVVRSFSLPVNRRDRRPNNHENIKQKERIMAKKARNSLTPKQVVKMMQDWDKKTLSDFATEFDVAPTTVSNMANAIYAQSDGQHCKPKARSAKEVALEALRLFKEAEGEELVQYVI